MDIQRQNFEEAFKKNNTYNVELIHGTNTPIFGQNSKGEYLKTSVQNHWEMWQQAQKVAVPNKMEIEIKAHNLDCQIDELKSEIIEKNFISNELDDQLEDLIIKAIDLGELYAKRDFVAVPEGFVLVPKTNSDAGIESMAMRYRHDFPLLDADYQEGIKSQMRQLYEEAVGLGFYSHKAQEQVG